MNCERARAIIVLRESDDASVYELRALEGHLGQCAGCAGLAATLRLLPMGEIRSELPLDEGDFATIRLGVMKGIATGTGRGQALAVRWTFAMMAVVALLVIGVTLGRRGPEREHGTAANVPGPAPVPAVATAPAPTVGTEPTARTARPTVSLAAEPISSREASTAPGPAQDETATVIDHRPAVPLRIELHTNDPNIRIIWVTSPTLDEPSAAAEPVSDTR